MKRHVQESARGLPDGDSSGGGPLNIGQASRLSGVSAKMIRHYESLKLLPRVGRTEAGYRQYRMSEVHTLQFIRRARDLGFSMAEIGELLGLWQNRRRASASVKRIALAHVDALTQRIEEMHAMRRTLQALARDCHGDDRPDCPILDDLAGACEQHAPAAPRRTRFA